MLWSLSGRAGFCGESAARQRRGTTFTLRRRRRRRCRRRCCPCLCRHRLRRCRPRAASGSLHCSGDAGSETRQLRGSRNGRRPTELRHRGAGGTRSGRGQRGNPGEPGPERGAAGGRGGEVCSLRSWGSSSPARLSPPASPSGVGAPAGGPGDEPGLEVAGECGPGTRAGVASGEWVGYFRRGALSCPARVPLGPLQPRELTGHSLPAGILGQNCILRGCQGQWQDGEPCLTCYTSTKGKRRRIREGCGHRLGPA